MKGLSSNNGATSLTLALPSASPLFLSRFLLQASRFLAAFLRNVRLLQTFTELLFNHLFFFKQIKVVKSEKR